MWLKLIKQVKQAISLFNVPIMSFFLCMHFNLLFQILCSLPFIVLIEKKHIGMYSNLLF